METVNNTYSTWLTDRLLWLGRSSFPVPVLLRALPTRLAGKNLPSSHPWKIMLQESNSFKYAGVGAWGFSLANTEGVNYILCKKKENVSARSCTRSHHSCSRKSGNC